MLRNKLGLVDQLMKGKNQGFILPFFINFTTEKPNSGEEFLIIEVFPLINEEQMVGFNYHPNGWMGGWINRTRQFHQWLVINITKSRNS